MKSPLTGKRISPAEFKLIKADYLSGMSLAAVGRKHGRSRKGISDLLRRRGVPMRTVPGPKKLLSNGCFAPAKPLTKKQIADLISAATKLRVPDELKLEWRKWPLGRRARFIERLRRHLKQPGTRPTTPFSDNVEPFAYGHKKAHEIAARMNAGTDARHAKVKINISSQGVIFEDQLWFWSPKIGYVRGPWSPEHGRPPLHHIIWEREHGPVKDGHVVIHSDGNRNNLDPSNLKLVDRDYLCRQNQAAALQRKSRQQVTTLLKRQTRTRKTNDLLNDLTNS